MPTKKPRNLDHVRHHNIPQADNEAITKQLQVRWHKRQKRPLPTAVKYAQQNFEKIWIADSSTLEALFRKLDSLNDVPQGKLAGKMCTVIDLLTRLPIKAWFDTNPMVHDTNFI